MKCTNFLIQGYSLCPKRVLVVSPVKLYIKNTIIKTSERMSHSLTFGSGIGFAFGFGYGLNNYNGCFSYFPFRKWQLISSYNCKRFYVSSRGEQKYSLISSTLAKLESTLTSKGFRAFNSLEWVLNSPPRPHAFNSQPIQSDLSLLTTLCTASVLTSAISNISTVISNLFYAVLCVSIPLVLLFVLYSTKPTMGKGLEGKNTFKPGLLNKEEDNRPTEVNMTYIQSITRLRKAFFGVLDLNDCTCGNLKRLYPQNRTKVVDLPELGLTRKGLKFERANNSFLTNASSATSEHFIETTYTENGVTYEGIWIPRAQVTNANIIGFVVTSLGRAMPVSANGRSVFVFKT